MSADGEALAEAAAAKACCIVTGRCGFAPVLRDHLARLGAAEGAPVLISAWRARARAGSRHPIQVPTRLDALHEGAIQIDAPGDIRILPGIAQARPDRPDVMRGEDPAPGRDRTDFSGLVCIPGTHSKWVRIEAGRIVEFSTYMTGELYALIRSTASSPTPSNRRVHARWTAGPFREGLRRRWLRPRP